MPCAAPVTIATLSLSLMRASRSQRLAHAPEVSSPRIARPEGRSRPFSTGYARGRQLRAFSAPPEQAIEKPAVESAVDGLRSDLRAELALDRRRRRSNVRQRRGERGRGRKSRQRGDRHALMGGLHEPRPDIDRQAAAGRLLGRGGIVVAEPDPGDEVAGIADEPGVAEILARAGLAGGLP